MRLFVTGATGLIGRRLVAARSALGDRIVALSRSADRARETLGDRAGVELAEGDVMEAGDWRRRVDGCDAVVHLAGAGIADRRWSKAYKELLVDSRVKGTRHVVGAMAEARNGPSVLVSASAVGYYGDRGATELDESAAAGDDFLARLTVRWEREAARAADAGARVAMLRFGAVLDPRGGALQGLLPVFRLGLGGPIGRGRQYMPWVHHRDVTGLVDLALREDGASGPLNAVGPEAVTNREFARALGRALGRPAVLPVPPPALRLALGEVARYVTMSQRVVPAEAERLGYGFAFPRLGDALEDLV